jgi:hypothetical protein
MHKAANPSGFVDSSNPRRQRGWQLSHHDGGAGVCCSLVWSSALAVRKKVGEDYVLLSGPPRLAPHHEFTQL